MAVPNLSELATTTLQKFSPKIADNVSKNNAILFMLQEKAEKPVGGGRTIVESLSFAENSYATSYSGYEQVPVGANDVISGAEYDWKQYMVPVTISGLEELQNAGESQIYPLLASRIKVAMSTLKNRISQDIYGDGTGNGGKNLDGLDLLVPQDPTTGTAGGIDRSLHTFWRSQLVDPASTPTSSTIQGSMTELFLECTRDGDAPKFIIAGSTIYQAYVASLQANMRHTNAKLADAGFINVEFMGKPVIYDGGIGGFATATDMYFLNPEYLHWRPHSKRNFVPDPKKRHSTNQDATVQFILFAGNLTCSGAQFQGRLKGD